MNDPAPSGPSPSSAASDVPLAAMLDLLATVLGELNVGLLVYRLETPDDPASLRLLYANRAASDATRADLGPLVGKRIGEAFPALADTELPALYAEVARSGRSRNVGAIEYPGDGTLGHAYYAVKAFPMPSGCVGVAFENITVRKQLEDLLRRQKPG